ncbi:ABC transporter ATP-binding protein [Catellatospora coxensis]|uniref:ABC transporter ATP-binding protein n=1 Tax=Catellatospora coxensis TaxID=310354 RepID=A0A8J3P921_9ACTN|nr:ABC transporter ATP-binding protein [Catellatospora coxensis]GIG08791.1 ABC transporter ATP-binding protein [Catellatospora coxensis]
MTALLDLRGIGLTYPGPPPYRALRECDLTVAAGDHVVILGPSGSGKSTLLNVVGLLDRPTEGRYEFEGVDTAGLGNARRAGLRARRIGFVFQAFHLMPHRSALDNVTVALMYSGVPSARRRRTGLEMLDRVGLAHRAYALPSQLSGGERQRVAIARALAPQPALLLCDEPTGNLDSATAERILDLIEEVRAAGQTVVTITHDPVVAARGRRAVTIRDGRLTESTPAAT